MIKLPFISIEVMRVLLCLQIGVSNLIYTLSVIIQDSRTDNNYKGLSLELNSALGQIMASYIPRIAKLPEPVPTITYWVLGLSAILIISSIGPAKSSKEFIK